MLGSNSLFRDTGQTGRLGESGASAIESVYSQPKIDATCLGANTISQPVSWMYPFFNPWKLFGWGDEGKEKEEEAVDKPPASPLASQGKQLELLYLALFIGLGAVIYKSLR